MKTKTNSYTLIPEVYFDNQTNQIVILDQDPIDIEIGLYRAEYEETFLRPTVKHVEKYFTYIGKL